MYFHYVLRLRSCFVADKWFRRNSWRVINLFWCCVYSTLPSWCCTVNPSPGLLWFPHWFLINQVILRMCEVGSFLLGVNNLPFMRLNYELRAWGKLPLWFFPVITAAKLIKQLELMQICHPNGATETFPKRLALRIPTHEIQNLKQYTFLVK